MVAATGSEKSIVSTENRDVSSGDDRKEFIVESYNKHYVDYLNRFGTVDRSAVPAVEEEAVDTEASELLDAELMFSTESDLAADEETAADASEFEELPEFLQDGPVEEEEWEVEAPAFDSEAVADEAEPEFVEEGEVEPEFMDEEPVETDADEDSSHVEETEELAPEFVEPEYVDLDPEAEEAPVDEQPVSDDDYYYEDEPAEELAPIAEDDVSYEEHDGGVEIMEEDEGVGFYSPEPAPAPAPQVIEREIVREVIVVDREQARDLGYGDARGNRAAETPAVNPSPAPPFHNITRNPATPTPTPAPAEERHLPGSYDQPDVQISSSSSQDKGLFGGLFKKKGKDAKDSKDSKETAHYSSAVEERREFQEPSRLRSEGLDSDFSVNSDAEENKVISVTTQENYDPREERRRLQHAGAESRPHVDPAGWLEQTMIDALKLDASDLHIVIEGETGNLRARIRVDGQMRDFDYVTGTPARVIMGRLKAATNLSSGGSYAPEEAIYEIELDGEKRKARAVLFRVEDGGEALVMRLPLTGSLRQLDELEFSDENLQYVYELLAMPYKLIMLAGPMGSGKTTTAHGALMHIADPTRTVWTIEDPVERRLPNLVQLEIDEENEAGFDVLLSKLLRADYNTLFLGEIRDPDTASAAVRQAKAGRQVMSTIHADDNIKSLMRLIELAGDSPMSVLSAVGGVVSQRLVRKLNPAWDGQDPKTKYKGRVPIHEILFVNDSIVEVMMQDRPLSEIKQEVKQAKGSSFYSDAVRLIAAGITDREEVVRVIGEFDAEDR